MGMKMRAAGVLATLIITIWSQYEAGAWEATYNRAVRHSLQKLREGSLDLEPFNPRNIKYPTDEGAQLGQGWDLFLNNKVASTCIEFQAQRDKFETAEFNYQEATDEETRDATLNMTFTIAGGASTHAYGDYKGNSSLTKNSFTHYYSKDMLLIGHASITNGALFAVPNTNPKPSDNGAIDIPSAPPGSPNHKGSDKSLKSIRLLPGLAVLKRRQPEVFRSMCGDGFVASINFGADLYSLLTVRNAQQTTREELATAVRTSGGYDGFTASGSGSISQILQDSNNKLTVTIQLIQQGGEIKSLPTNVKELQDKIKALPQEAWNGPKPTFMVIYPYSQLPEFQGKGDQGYSTTLQAAVRYGSRLRTIHSEILDMQADYERDRTPHKKPDGTAISNVDSYYFSYEHQLRSENLQLQREKIEGEIDRVSDLIGALSKCPRGCTGKDPKKLPKPISDALGDPPRVIDPPLASLPGQKVDSKKTEFDDLLYWMQLPLPRTAISDDDITMIASLDTDYETKKAIFARDLYRHWILRQDAARCSLYYECLSQDQKDYYYSEIMKTLLRTQQYPKAITATWETNNQWRLTIAPCTAVLVTNARSASTSNYFSISRRDDGGNWDYIDKDLKDRPGESSYNKRIEPIQPLRAQQWKIQAWFTSDEEQPEEQPMWNSTMHLLPSSTTELWFQDAGSNAGGPPNLTVDFKAIKESGPGCPSP
jgi:hypothetical protein